MPPKKAAAKAAASKAHPKQAPSSSAKPIAQRSEKSGPSNSAASAAAAPPGDSFSRGGATAAAPAPLIHDKDVTPQEQKQLRMYLDFLRNLNAATSQQSSAPSPTLSASAAAPTTTEAMNPVQSSSRLGSTIESNGASGISTTTTCVVAESVPPTSSGVKPVAKSTSHASAIEASCSASTATSSPAKPSSPTCVNAVAERGPVPKTLSQWIRCYHPAIREMDVGLKTYAQEVGFPYTVDKGANLNTHSVSAFCRETAVLMFLEQVAADHPRSMSILSWNGMDRETRINPALPLFRRPRTDPLENTDLEISWTLGRGATFSGDAARSITQRRLLSSGSEQFDGVWVCDVYRDNGGPFTPDTMLHLINMSRTGKVYGVWREFPGLGGSDPELVPGRVEGVYTRTEAGMVTFSPDRNQPAYVPHSDVNWMWSSSCGGVDISFIRQIGPYTMFVFAKTGENSLHIGEPVSREGDIQMMTVEPWWGGPINALFKLASWRPPAQTQVMFSSCLLPSVVAAITRQPNGITMDTVLAAVAAAAEKRHHLVAIRERFNAIEFYRDLVYGTAVAAMYLNRRKWTDTLYDMRATHYDSEVRLTQVRGSTFLSPKSPRSWVPYAVGVPVALFVAHRYLRRGQKQPTPASFMPLLHTILTNEQLVRETAINALVSPVAEEAVKYLFPQAWPAIPLFEMVMHLRHGRWFQALMIFVAHNAFAQRHRVGRPGQAIVLHSLHNFVPVAVTLLTWCAGCPPPMPMVAGFWTQVMGLVAVAPLALFNVRAACSEYYATARSAVAWIQRRTRRRDDDAFRHFAAHHAIGQRVPSPRSVWSALAEGTTIVPYNTEIVRGPLHMRGQVDIRINGEPHTIESALAVLPATVPEGQRMWAILVTSGLLWQPARSPRNLLAAVVTRIHRDPFVGMASPADRDLEWDRAGQLIISLGWQPGGLFEKSTIPECAAFMGSRAKGRRLLQAAADDEAGNYGDLKKEQKLKWNETIPLKDVDGVITLKPRPITNLDPIYHARTIAEVRAFADYMHAFFDGQPLIVGEVTVRIFFASGSSGRRLNEIGAALNDPWTVTLAVAGDDVAIGWGPLAGLFGAANGEADMSMMDHSQNEGPMWTSLGLMEVWGVTHETLDALRQCVTASYTAVMRYEGNELRMRGHAGVQMPTGATITTTVTSLNCIMMLMGVVRLSQQVQSPDFACLCARFGLTAKYIARPNFHEMTFLRGWWQPTGHDEFGWVPLPSAVLKIGKIMSDYRKLSSAGARAVAFAAACSLGHVPDDYPILGAFLSTLRRLGKETAFAHTWDIRENPHKSVALAEGVDRGSSMMAVCSRYNITEGDVLRAETLLRCVASLPAYIEDPVFMVLAAVDY